MKKLKSKNGITLIALIITIIILLILAMVTINILINQGIIGHANNAVRGYEVSEEKELIALAYQHYKMDKVNNKDAELTVDGATTEWEADENTWYIEFTKTHHNYSLTENGDIATTGERWKKNSDGELVKGDMTLKVGDYVDYDHTRDADGNLLTTSYTSYAKSNASADKNNGRSSGYTENQSFNISDYTGGWRVLGIKNGQIELISSTGIKPDESGYKLRSYEGLVYGVGELNAICSIYGKGKGAKEARSISVEDVNRITGYNPQLTDTGHPYNKGKISEYGNKVTYKKTNGGAACVCSNGADEEWEGYGLQYLDDQQCKGAQLQEGETKTFINTLYFYSIGDKSKGSIKGIEDLGSAYELLFGENYWLASRLIACQKGYINYYMMDVWGKSIQQGLNYNGYSVGYDNVIRGIRPIVTLNSDVVITKDADHDGTSSKPCTIQ